MSSSEKGLILACLVMPFAMMFFGWCGHHIRRIANNHIPEGKVKRILLRDLHSTNPPK